MGTQITRPSINVREKISENYLPSGAHGAQLARSESPQETFNIVRAGRKNLIINGDFQISQRGDYTSSTSLGNSQYYLDRWFRNGNSNGGETFQHKINQAVPTENGTVYVNTHLATAVNAGGWLSHGQQIEPINYRHLKGKWVTASVYVKTNNPYMGLRIYDSAAAVSQHIGMRHSGNGTWERLSMRHYVPYNSNNLYPLIDHYDGTVQYTRAGDYVEYTMLQVEEGLSPTPFEHRFYAEELQLCKRYYRRFVSGGAYGRFGLGYAPSGSTVRLPIRLDPEMRVAAADSNFSTGGSFSLQPGTWGSPTVTCEDNSSSKDVLLIKIDSTSVTTGHSVSVHANNDVDAYFDISAEL